ncbi:MAG: serine--tRNA ligase [Candidatus Kerfeldbacteria bacterium]|nr:serine--tRNA ligase [Candidatus Kerfeldbacteria bacterium]
MLDIKYIRSNTEEVKKALQRRSKRFADEITSILSVDEKRKKLSQELEVINAQKNSFSKEILKLADAEKKKAIAKFAKLKSQEESLTADLRTCEVTLQDSLRKIPNLPAAETPNGATDKDNKEIRVVGEQTKFSFTPLDYVTLAERHGLIDTERAAKISGSRFGFLTGRGAILWNALVQFTLQEILKAGFTPFYSPVLVKKEVMVDSGYDSYVEGGEAYLLEQDGLYLVGTGEHALLPYHRDEILQETDLPRKYTTYSSCFRREAGSYGKDTKGILRVHQFDKQELVVLTTPHNAVKVFDELVALQESIISQLELSYHLLAVCTGDLPRPSSRVTDLECWIPSEKKYRETHSASNCTDYQARLNNIRYKTKEGKTQFVHILNATAMTPRTLIAILEQHQRADGSIAIPKVLHPFTFGLTSITS